MSSADSGEAIAAQGVLVQASACDARSEVLRAHQLQQRPQEELEPVAVRPPLGAGRGFHKAAAASSQALEARFPPRQLHPRWRNLRRPATDGGRKAPFGGGQVPHSVVVCFEVRAESDRPHTSPRSRVVTPMAPIPMDIRALRAGPFVACRSDFGHLPSTSAVRLSMEIPQILPHPHVLMGGRGGGGLGDESGGAGEKGM